MPKCCGVGGGCREARSPEAYQPLRHQHQQHQLEQPLLGGSQLRLFVREGSRTPRDHVRKFSQFSVRYDAVRPAGKDRYTG